MEWVPCVLIGSPQWNRSGLPVTCSQAPKWPLYPDSAGVGPGLSGAAQKECVMGRSFLTSVTFRVNALWIWEPTALTFRVKPFPSGHIFFQHRHSALVPWTQRPSEDSDTDCIRNEVSRTKWDSLTWVWGHAECQPSWVLPTTYIMTFSKHP